MDNAPRLVEISVRLYRVLIGVYPQSFRQKFADEMTLVFHDAMTGAWRDRGTFGVVGIWLRVLLDLAGTVPREYWTHFWEWLEMKSAAFAIFSSVVSVVISVIVFYVLSILYFLSWMAWRWMVGTSIELSLQPHPVLEVLALFLPAFLTGFLVYRAKPFCAPFITAPVGIMLLWGMISFAEDSERWWIHAGFVAAMGLITILGCVVSARIVSRRAKTSSPPEDLPASS